MMNLAGPKHALRLYPTDIPWAMDKPFRVRPEVGVLEDIGMAREEMGDVRRVFPGNARWDMFANRSVWPVVCRGDTSYL